MRGLTTKAFVCSELKRTSSRANKSILIMVNLEIHPSLSLTSPNQQKSYPPCSSWTPPCAPPPLRLGAESPPEGSALARPRCSPPRARSCRRWSSTCQASIPQSRCPPWYSPPPSWARPDQGEHGASSWWVPRAGGSLCWLRSRRSLPCTWGSQRTEGTVGEAWHQKRWSIWKWVGCMKIHLQVSIAFLHMAACSEAECKATPLTATSPHLHRKWRFWEGASIRSTHQPLAPGMLLKPGSSFHILGIAIRSLPSARISFQLARIFSKAFATPVSSTFQTGLDQNNCINSDSAGETCSATSISGEEETHLARRPYWALIGLWYLDR